MKLDRASARSLALVARRYTAPAEHKIWQSLDILLSPSYGEYPLIQPNERSDYGKHLEWAKAQAKEAEERHRLALKERVKRIILLTNERRIGLVEEIIIVQRPGANNGIIQLLEFVAPRLKRLVLKARAIHQFQNEWREKNHELMDVKVIGNEMKFKSLTHLTIQRGAIRFVEYLIEIIGRSPNLIYLDADVSDIYKIAEWEDDIFPVFREHLDETNIRQLQLTFGDIVDDVIDDPDNPIILLLHNVPHAERICIHYLGHDDDVERYVCELASGLEDMKVLSLSINISKFCDYIKEGDPGFTSL